MYKNTNFKEKFTVLKNWMPVIIESIKKDVRNEHLKQDLYFAKKYFGLNNIHKVSTDELAKGYLQAIMEEEKGEELGEFILSRWILKNTELYEFFENQLNQVTADFTAIEELPHDQSKDIAQKSIAEHGAVPTYLFAVLNSVVFPKEVFDHLEKEASKAQKAEIEKEKHEDAKQSVESLKSKYEQEIARINDKSEKKLAGLQKKYLNDTEALKKQIAALQRKLQHKDA